MAITIDDLPAHGDLPPDLSRVDVARSMLQTLHEARMPAVYGFINAQSVADEPETEEVLKVWRTAGNPLGNHTWSHPNLDGLTAAQFEADILKNEPMLDKHMAKHDWHWFRYPYLAEGDTLHKRNAVRLWLREHQYRIAEVSMDFEDYLWNDPYARCMVTHDEAAIARLHDSYLQTAQRYVVFFRRLSKRVYGRDVRYILLLHLGAFDAHMLPELLDLYRRDGFRFVSLPEAEADPIYRGNPSIGLKGGGAFQELWMEKLKLHWPPDAKPYKQLENTCR